MTLFPSIKASLIALSVFAFCLASVQAHAASLMEIYNQALDNDYIYQAAKAEFSAQVQQKNIARSALLPNIRGDVSWAKTNTDTTNRAVDFSVIDPNDPALRAGSSSDNTQTGYSIRLDQALIDFSSWNSYQSGKVSADIAQASLDEAKQDLILRVAEAYFAALAAVDNLDTTKAEEKALGLQLDQTRQRFEVGLTAITDVHEAQAVFDSSTASRLAAEGDVEIAFEELAVIGGRAYDSLKPLKPNFPVTPPQPNDRNQWVDFALANNLDLLTSSLEVKSANYDYKAAKSDHLPTLSAAVSYGDSTTEIEGISGQPDTESDRAQQRVSVTLNVPIFAGGRTHALRKRAGARAWQRKELYNQTKRVVTRQARSTFIQVVTGVSTVKARAQAIRSNESALEATQAGYDVGTRDLVDVLQAQQSLFRARRNYSTALYNYINNTLGLKKIAGTLTVADIQALSDWLNLEKNVFKTF